MNSLKNNIILASLISILTVSAFACDGGTCTIGDNKANTAKDTTTETLKAQIVAFLKKNGIKIGAGTTGTAATVFGIKKLKNTKTLQAFIASLRENSLLNSVYAKCPNQKALSITALCIGLTVAAYGFLSQENEIDEAGDEVITQANTATISSGAVATLAGVIGWLKSPKEETKSAAKTEEPAEEPVEQSAE